MIERRERAGHRAERGCGCRDVCQKLAEYVLLNGYGPIGGGDDPGFRFTQLARGEAHGVGHGLAMNEGAVLRSTHQLIAMGGGHLDEISQHIVMADFERPYAGVLRVLLLHGGDDLPAFVPQGPGFIEVGVIAMAHEPAIAPLGGQIVTEGLGQFHSQRLGRADQIAGQGSDNIRQRFAAVLKLASSGAGTCKRVPDNAQIARAATPYSQPRQRPRKIGAPFQRRAQLRPRTRLLKEICGGIETRRYFLRVGQRARQPGGKFTRPGAGDRAVECIQQGAAPLAGDVFHKLQIDTCRGIDHQHVLRPEALGRSNKRLFAELREIDIF